jgi:hypothetical protein
MFQRLRTDPFFLVQVVLIALLAIFFKPLSRDFRSIITEQATVPYLIIWGFVAILADAWGGIVKSRQIGSDIKAINMKRTGAFLFIFWILRCAPVAFSVMTISASMAGSKRYMEQNWATAFLIVCVLWWLVQGFWTWINISEKPRPVSAQKAAIADLALFISSSFFLFGMWFSTDMTGGMHWDTMNGSDWAELLIAGLVLYLMIHVPANIYLHLYRLNHVKSRRQYLLFWLGIIGSGYAILLYPVLF